MPVGSKATSVAGGLLGTVSETALWGLLLLPFLTGAAGGYAKGRMTSPSDQDVSNLGREMLLSHIEAGRLETRRLAAIRAAKRKELEEGGQNRASTVLSEASREIHI